MFESDWDKIRNQGGILIKEYHGKYIGDKPHDTGAILYYMKKGMLTSQEVTILLNKISIDGFDLITGGY